MIYYSVNHLHGAPDYSILERNLKDTIIRHNLSFQNFLKLSEEKFSLLLEINQDVRFCNKFLVPFYRAVLNLLLFMLPLHIAGFENDLKMIIERNFKSDIKDWMHLTTFKKDLEEFFIKKFDAVLPLLLEKIHDVKIERFTDVQIKNITCVEISNIFLTFSFENISKISYNYYFNINKQFVDFFYKQLFSFKKKYRVFFILTGIEYEGEKIDFNGIKIYNDKWYFYESSLVEQQFLKHKEILDRYKFKIFCDVETHNIYDALIMAKQKCNIIISSISFTYQLYQNHNSNVVTKPVLFHLFEIFEVIEFPAHYLGKKIVKWPIKLRKNNEDFLRDLVDKSFKNEIVKMSLTWFKESYYSEQSFSKFVFYWTGLEGIAKSIKKMAMV